MSRSLTNFASLALLVHPAFGDSLLYRYEGDVLPHDPAAGWVIANPCDLGCNEFVRNGHFVFSWPTDGGTAIYRYDIARPGTPPPPETLWVEWRFRSNHPLGRNFFICDGSFGVHYGGMFDYVNMYGDAVISSSGSFAVLNLPFDEFHLFRYESLDGAHYTFSVDGRVFLTSFGNQPNGVHTLGMYGIGGCLGDWIPGKENAWDFVRFGTIDYGENIVGSDPPAGFVDARAHPSLDRFTIRYDSPNYAYLDEITVEATEGIAPISIATRRLDNGPPDVVEIVLDRPIPHNATTRFTFDDGTLSQTVEFTYAPGDANGDGRADLSDFAAFQTCFGAEPLTGLCLALDADSDADLDLGDAASFLSLLGRLMISAPGDGASVVP